MIFIEFPGWFGDPNTLSPGNGAEESDDIGEDDDEWELLKPITGPCDSISE
jgi:hypothetical protein